MVFQGTYKLMIEKKSLDLLKTLIGFDTTSFKSNLNLIMFIEDYLNQYKIKSELVYDETKNKANLFATIGPNSSGGIVLSGHTDVVPVTNQKWDSDPFQLIEKDQKLYGRGTSDMKSFIGLVLSRVPKIVEKKLSKPIHLAFSYDEEIGCVGVHGLLELIEKKSIKPEFCIVGEPTSMEVVIGHKGKHAYSVKVEGLIDLIWHVATSRRILSFSSMKSNVAFNPSPLAFECEFLIIRNRCHSLQSKASHSNYRRFIIANNQDIVDSDSCIFDMCTYRTQPQLLVFFRNT